MTGFTVRVPHDAVLSAFSKPVEVSPSHCHRELNGLHIVNAPYVSGDQAIHSRHREAAERSAVLSHNWPELDQYILSLVIRSTTKASLCEYV